MMGTEVSQQLLSHGFRRHNSRQFSELAGNEALPADSSLCAAQLLSVAVLLRPVLRLAMHGLQH
jgi:hypothetical protein